MTVSGAFSAFLERINSAPAIAGEEPAGDTLRALHALYEWHSTITEKAQRLDPGAAEFDIVQSANDYVSGFARAGRLDEAVAVAESALARTTEAGLRESLMIQLADILTTRGVLKGNASPSRWAEACDDLRRALALRPGALRTTLNLATALQGLAHEHIEDGRLDAAIDALNEARATLLRESRHGPEQAELASKLREIEAELDAVGRWESFTEDIDLLMPEHARRALGVLLRRRKAGGDEAKGVIRRFPRSEPQG